MTTAKSRSKPSASRFPSTSRLAAAVLVFTLAAAGVSAARVSAARGSAGAFTVGGKAVDKWPYKTLQLGLLSPPGSAAGQRRAARFGFRYAYLSGGVNTGKGWRTWANGNGDYVSLYIAEAERAHMVPVFSYYQIRQSAPGYKIADEATGDLSNLSNRRTMYSYFQDLKAFFQQAAAAKRPVVLQVEPDMWGYIEQASHGDAERVKVAVAKSGLPDLRGLPNNASGLAQAILVLRNNYAPHVIVAYHDSSWGTDYNIQSSHPSSALVKQMAAESVKFYRSLHANFNAIFTETSDRDAGYAQVVDGEGTSQWWAPVDFRHLGAYIAAIHRAVKLPVVIWQIPVGNTIMRVLNNTPYHYQDNKVQTLLAPASAPRRLLESYAKDGVAALLFGAGQTTDTCACDNDHNSRSNEPAPIDHNTQRSYSDDDDGGYLAHVAAAYYHRGALRLP